MLESILIYLRHTNPQQDLGDGNAFAVAVGQSLTWSMPLMLLSTYLATLGSDLVAVSEATGINLW